MKIRAFSDYHVHVRDGQRLKDVVPYTAVHCGRFMVMPNLEPHITHAHQMMLYRETIRHEIKYKSEVLTTISLTEETTPKMIRLAAASGCTAVKLYPGVVMSYDEVAKLAIKGNWTADGLYLGEVTTNSHCGISRNVLLSLIEPERKNYSSVVQRFWENLQVIDNSDLVLCIHGELPGEEVLARERAMLPLVRSILKNFKKIRVVMEHITTSVTVDTISQLARLHPGRIAATITPHHLMYTLTDLLGGKLRPHLFCKPVLGTRNDLRWLLEAATSCESCFFLGSDTAPWGRGEKECSEGCAGIWNAPVLVSAMFEIFERKDSLPLLEDFTSTFGDLFYHKPHVDRYLEVEKSRWLVPPEIHGIVPFLAEQTMEWRVVS